MEGAKDHDSGHGGSNDTKFRFSRYELPFAETHPTSRWDDAAEGSAKIS